MNKNHTSHHVSVASVNFPAHTAQEWGYLTQEDHENLPSSMDWDFPNVEGRWNL